MSHSPTTPDPLATPDRIRDAIVAAENGDPDALRAVLARAVVWHTPSHNLLGGDHMGAEQVITLLKEQQRLTRGSFHVDRRSAPPNAVVLHATGSRDGHGTLDQDEEIRYALEDGKIGEMWSKPRDITAWDRFFAP